jgi:hypothetical protein
MDLTGFKKSLAGIAPPPAVAAPLQALWWAAKGDWTKAHEVAQSHEGEAPCDWVHAYLHRVEGDLGNAGYWYRRAGKPPATGALAAEWDAMVAALL